MIVALDWLKDWIETDLTAEQIADELSVKGLEVEHIENYASVKGDLSGFIVAEVKEKVKHPNADKLNVTQVWNGKEILQIVCGASNVEVGQKVVLATIGTTINLPNGSSFEIKESEIRGQKSSGMLCAEDEIGLGTNHNGILVLPANTKVGSPLSKLFENHTTSLLEIGLTANRGDAASHLGVCRDLGAMLNLPVKSLTNAFIAKTAIGIKIDIENSETCSSYKVLELQTAIEESPMWLKNRLQSIGIAPKNNVVDIVNYILHDMGQPMHAFDADTIGSVLQVRLAKSTETLELLDGTTVKLQTTDLIIADENGPLSLAGVMGGKKSMVTEKTTKIALECACFNAVNVRKTAKNHGKNTDSSYRFERGVDPLVGEFALQKTLELLIEFASAKELKYNEFKNNKPLIICEIHKNYFNKIAGSEIPKIQSLQILTSLGFKVQENDETYDITIPSWRTDCNYPIDVAEEVLRIYGFDNLPMPQKIAITIPVFKGLLQHQNISKIRQNLVTQGFNEIITNSLVDLLDYHSQPKENVVALSNPLSSEMGVMRTSLLHGILQTISYNSKRAQTPNLYFEIGKVQQIQESNIVETKKLIIGVSGFQKPLNWESKPAIADFYYLKGVWNNLNQSLNKSLNADIQLVPNNWLKYYDILNPVYFIETDLNNLIQENNELLKVKEVSKFPSIKRDLSIVCKANIPFSYWENSIKKADKTMVEFAIFDIYKGKPLADDEHSISITFTFSSSEKTLVNEEIDAIIQELILDFEKNGALIRK